MATNPTCNICGSTRFAPYRGRPAELCEGCGAKARHRAAFAVYRDRLPGFAGGAGGRVRVLHLAPEAALHGPLSEAFGAGYVTADAEPERYPHARALRLRLPQDLARFPDGWCDGLLHNHVLEHLPGRVADHLPALARLVAPGGVMIFTIPGPHDDRETQEGGEHLGTDAERLARFLQEDHYKLFGRDFAALVDAIPGGRRVPDGLDDARRAAIAVRPGKGPVWVWQRDA